MTVRRMSARRARAIIDAATLVKAADWREFREWHVVSGDEVLVVIAPSYGGTGRSGRNGWRWRLADAGGYNARPEPTREQAAAAGLAAWQRRATATGK